jgi:hypothetical protein
MFWRLDGPGLCRFLAEKSGEANDQTAQRSMKIAT